MSAAKSTTPAFEVVYDSKGAPKSLHARTEQECWKGHMREATAEELERLKDARCKHCVTRVARLTAEAEKARPKRQPVPRNDGKQQSQAVREEVKA